jgi:hypothetical protein
MKTKKLEHTINRNDSTAAALPYRNNPNEDHYATEHHVRDGGRIPLGLRAGVWKEVWRQGRIDFADEHDVAPRQF